MDLQLIASFTFLTEPEVPWLYLFILEEVLFEINQCEYLRMAHILNKKKKKSTFVHTSGHGILTLIVHPKNIFYFLQLFVGYS